jgi:hypothetical protein
VGADVPGGAFASEWYQSGFFVCIFQAKGARKERSTLIHIKVVSERVLVCIFQARGEKKRQEEDRVVEDSVMIVCR